MGSGCSRTYHAPAPESLHGLWESSEGKQIDVCELGCSFNGGRIRPLKYQGKTLALNGWKLHRSDKDHVVWKKGREFIEWHRVKTDDSEVAPSNEPRQRPATPVQSRGDESADDSDIPLESFASRNMSSSSLPVKSTDKYRKVPSKKRLVSRKRLVMTPDSAMTLDSEKPAVPSIKKRLSRKRLVMTPDSAMTPRSSKPADEEECCEEEEEEEEEEYDEDEEEEEEDVSSPDLPPASEVASASNPDAESERVVLPWESGDQADADAESVPPCPEFHVPAHWTNFARDPTDTARGNHFFEEHTVDLATREMLEKLAQTCMKSGDIEISEAWRVENSKIWAGYVSFREQLASTLSSRCTSVNELDGNPNAGQVVSDEFFCQSNVQDEVAFSFAVDDTLNEHYLWHGCKLETARKIAQDDFKIPGKPWRYGRGAYFHESLDKSLTHAFAESDGRRCVILSRVCCGHMLYTEEPSRNNMHEEALAQGYNSILGNPRRAGPREFVVLEAKQVYPEYVVMFESSDLKRLPSIADLSECASESPREDPLRAARSMEMARFEDLGGEQLHELEGSISGL